MTIDELSRFRNVLQATVIELDGALRRRDGILIEESADELDRVLRAAERELAVHSLEGMALRRRNVRSALRRIDEGKYGLCEECDERINPKRLAALPTAALCIRCQQEEDDGMNGLPKLGAAA